MGSLPHPSTHLGQAFLLYDHHLRSWEWEEHLFSGPINGCMVQSLVLLVPHLFKAVSNRAKESTVFEALTEIRWISNIQGHIRQLFWLNTSTYGTVFQILYCSQRSRTHILGNYHLQKKELCKICMKGCLLVQFSSSHGKEYGRIGHLVSVNSLCGWLPITNVGQFIASPGGGWHTLNAVHSVTKLKRQLTTC